MKHDTEDRLLDSRLRGNDTKKEKAVDNLAKIILQKIFSGAVIGNFFGKKYFLRRLSNFLVEKTRYRLDFIGFSALSPE